MTQETLPLHHADNSFSSQNLSKKVNFNGIDVMKFLCAIFVCTIHIEPFGRNIFGVDLNFWLMNYVCRVAVPFYFVSAGFFLFRKIDTVNPDFGIIKNYCFKIARLLGVWTIILFFGWAGHLWYLNGLFVAVLILSLLFYLKVKFGYICFIALLLYIIGASGGPYYGFIEPLKDFKITGSVMYYYNEIFSTTRNGLFFGVPFVFMGAIFAKKRIEINNIVALFGFIVSFVVLFFEVYLLSHFSSPKAYNMYLCLMPTMFFLFYFCSHIKLKNRAIYIKLRIYGILMYFLHMLVGRLAIIVYSAFKSEFTIGPFSFNFVFTIIITFCIAISIERLSEIKTFRWLKYLYS